MEWFSNQSLPIQIIVAVCLIAVITFALYAIFSIIGLPILALFSRATEPIENNTAAPEDSYLLGEVTLTTRKDNIGEVMVTGGGRARQTYSAKLFDMNDAPIEKGEKVVIIKFEDRVALIQKLKTKE